MLKTTSAPPLPSLRPPLITNHRAMVSLGITRTRQGRRPSGGPENGRENGQVGVHVLQGSTRRDVMEAAAGGVPLHIGEDRHQLRELLSAGRGTIKRGGGGGCLTLPRSGVVARAGYVTQGLMFPKRRMMWGGFCAIAHQEEPQRLSIHAVGQSVD